MSEQFQAFHSPDAPGMKLEHQNLDRNGPSTCLTTFPLDHTTEKTHPILYSLGHDLHKGFKISPLLLISSWSLPEQAAGFRRHFPWKWAPEKEAVGVCQAGSKLRSEAWHFLMHILNYNNRTESVEEELLQRIKGRSDGWYSCLHFLGNRKQYHLLIMLR